MTLLKHGALFAALLFSLFSFSAHKLGTYLPQSFSENLMYSPPDTLKKSYSFPSFFEPCLTKKKAMSPKKCPPEEKKSINAAHWRTLKLVCEGEKNLYKGHNAITKEITRGYPSFAVSKRGIIDINNDVEVDSRKSLPAQQPLKKSPFQDALAIAGFLPVNTPVGYTGSLFCVVIKNTHIKRDQADGIIYQIPHGKDTKPLYATRISVTPPHLRSINFNTILPKTTIDLDENTTLHLANLQHFPDQTESGCFSWHILKNKASHISTHCPACKKPFSLLKPESKKNL